MSRATVVFTKDTAMATGVITGPIESQTRTLWTSAGSRPGSIKPRFQVRYHQIR